MADHPILMSGEMVRAVLDGRKTQTRRLLTSPLRKAMPGDRLWVRETIEIQGVYTDGVRVVYEASRSRGGSEAIGMATTPPGIRVTAQPGKLRPSIHMPRWASRITLVVEDVRIQRLQDISEGDALSEGVPLIHEGNVGDEIFCPTCQGNGVHGALGSGYGVTEVDCSDCATAEQKFSNLWNRLHSKPGERWEDNPEVVAIRFAVHRCNIDEMEGAR